MAARLAHSQTQRPLHDGSGTLVEGPRAAAECRATVSGGRRRALPNEASGVIDKYRDIHIRLFQRYGLGGFIAKIAQAW